MLKSLWIGASIAAVALGAAPASAALFTIDYYQNYTETPNGVAVTGTPFFTESIDDVTFIDFNAANAPPGRPNANGPFAAYINGQFTVTGNQQVFSISSDDGSYVFLNGDLVGSNPGQHGYSTINVMTNLAPGNYTFQVQYFNGPCCGAAFGITATGVTFNPPPAAVPEPASWALLIGGFGMIGGALRARRGSTRLTYA